ncbi:hypothetical protein SOVF_024330 [Spinacia oleracea]|nr:hypothetical protein SOVF_024330 [Spinacia oleracea]
MTSARQRGNHRGCPREDDRRWCATRYGVQQRGREDKSMEYNQQGVGEMPTNNPGGGNGGQRLEKQCGEAA